MLTLLSTISCNFLISSLKFKAMMFHMRLSWVSHLTISQHTTYTFVSHDISHDKLFAAVSLARHKFISFTVCLLTEIFNLYSTFVRFVFVFPQIDLLCNIEMTSLIAPVDFIWPFLFLIGCLSFGLFLFGPRQKFHLIYNRILYRS